MRTIQVRQRNCLGQTIIREGIETVPCGEQKDLRMLEQKNGGTGSAAEKKEVHTDTAVHSTTTAPRNNHPLARLFAEVIAAHPQKTLSELCHTLELQHHTSMADPERRDLLAQVYRQATEVGADPSLAFANANGDVLPLAGEPAPDSTAPAFEVTLFRNAEGRITKSVELGTGGKLNIDGAPGLYRGTARRVRYDSLANFAEALTRCPANECFGLGQLVDGLEDEVSVVTIEKLNGGATARRISRSAEFFHYRPGPGVIAIDSDTKGQPDDVRARVEAAGGVWSALVQAIPELAGVGRVVRASTTAGLSAAKPIAGGTGEHIYMLAEDIADTDRFLTAAQGRCWLAGYGWYLISASGEPLVRSIVDISTGQPERLFYEGAPELGPGLTQDATARRARVVEGKALNTAAVALTEAEVAELATLLAAEKLRYGEQASATRAAWLADHIRRGGSEKTFRLAAEHHQLVPDFPLHFSSLGMATVADVLAHIETYAGRYLADPLEGVDYGKTKAIVLKWGNGTPYVRSFAHGLTTLFSLTDKAAGEAADIGEVEAALATLGAEADWHRAALATHAATGGSEAGWAALNGVHPIEREAWDALQPAVVTAGTLFYLANEARPGWREEYTARLEGELEKTNKASINTAGPSEEARSKSSYPGTEDAGADPSGAAADEHARKDQGEDDGTGKSYKDKGTRPVLGADAFHGFAGELVRTIEPHTEADPAALLLQFLVVFGNMVGRKRYYLIESDRHYQNLYTALVGDTSEGRKGTALGRIKAVVRVVDPDFVKKNMRGGLSSGEGLIHAVRDPTTKWDAEKKIEIEVDHGVEDKRLMIVEPEFASVLSVMERSGNTISPMLRNGWDLGLLATLTRAVPLTATDAHLSAIFHITKDELKARLTRTDIANGFANRILFAYVKRSKELPFGGDLSDSEIFDLGQRLQNIVDVATGNVLVTGCAQPPERLTMTDAARAEWACGYSALSRGRPGLLGAVTSRAAPQALRLALIFALLDKADQIDIAHLKAGLAVWTYCDEFGSLHLR